MIQRRFIPCNVDDRTVEGTSNRTSEASWLQRVVANTVSWLERELAVADRVDRDDPDCIGMDGGWGVFNDLLFEFDFVYLSEEAKEVFSDFSALHVLPRVVDGARSIEKKRLSKMRPTISNPFSD